MSRLNLTKGRVGSNVASGYVKCSALIGCFGSSVLTNDTPVKLLGVEDAIALGINEADTPLLYHHVSEYFRIGGRGVALWLLSVATATNMETLIKLPAIKSLIAQADGEIFQIGFCHIPATFTYAEDGLPQDFVKGITAAQGIADWCLETNRPLHVVLELAGYKGPASSAADLRNLKVGEVAVNASQVSVVIGQDYDFADTLSGSEKKYAAVGTVLGCMAYQPVNANIGEVGTMGLTDTGKMIWVNAGLSSHEKVKSVETDLVTLDAKGYIFGEYYSGNVVLNDDHVCCAEKVDADGNMNESCIAYSRTNNKVIRELYKAYLPTVKSNYPCEKDGTLSVGMVKYFEGLGDNIFDNMEKAQEISGGETIVDSKSNLLSGTKELKISYNWMPTGTVRYISGVINIKNTI